MIQRLSSASASSARPARSGATRPAGAVGRRAGEAASPQRGSFQEQTASNAADIAISDSRSAPRRAQPAAMLYAMFEQMGGAATSVWKGMHVNTAV